MRRAAPDKAIALDRDYADAVFNLATLEFDAGNLAEARRWWARYLELDQRLRMGAHGGARHRTSSTSTLRCAEQTAG